MIKKILFCLMILALVSCSESRPKFYPNQKYMSGGDYAAQRATDECMALADQYIKEPNMATESLKRGAIGAAAGAATGAVGGAIMGNAGRGTGAGAAIGGMLGVASGVYEASGHSQDYKSFVERCLQKKGFETIGWD